jgi:hypothetical protein
MSEWMAGRIYGGCCTVAILLGLAALGLWMFGRAPLAVIVSKLAALAAASAIATTLIYAATSGE